MAHGRRPDPKLAQFWWTTLTRWQASGLSVRHFCERHDLRESAFYFWRRRLAAREQPAAAAAATPPTPAFVRVRVLATPALDVVLPAGLVVRVPPGFDPALLRAVVAALEGTSC